MDNSKQAASQDVIMTNDMRQPNTHSRKVWYDGKIHYPQ